MIVAGSSLTNIPASLGAQLGRRHRRTDRGRLCANDTGDRLIPVPKSKAQFRRTRSERQDMPAAALFRNCGPWSLRSSEMKARFRSLAEQQQMMTESGLLKRLLDSAVRGAGESDAAVLKVPGRRLRGPRTCVRLHPDDKLLLSERAAARQTAVATYIRPCTRPSAQPRSFAQGRADCAQALGGRGRRHWPQPQPADEAGPSRDAGPTRSDLLAILKACEALRDRTKELIKANACSWAVGARRWLTSTSQAASRCLI
jgi:hypothetical protein